MILDATLRRLSRASRMSARRSGAVNLLLAVCALAVATGQGACDGTALGTGLPSEGAECATCHGTEGNAAPPASLSGETSTSDPAVGVHQAHLAGGKVRSAISCSECHIVPPTVDAPGHVDESPADLTFGALATANGAQPSYDPETGKCSSIYCHGGTLAGGRLTAPAWRTGCDACHGNPPEVGGNPPKAHPRDKDCSKCHPAYVDATGSVSFAGSKHPSPTGCDACHGAPPPEPHPQSTACALCHPGTVTDEGTIDIASGLHLNGSVEASGNGPHPDGYAAPTSHGQDFLESGSQACAPCHGTALDGGKAGTSCEKCHPGFRKSCTFCHGGTDNETGAPPESVLGKTDTTVPAVGAHTSHLAASDWRAPIQCSACHQVPSEALSEGHMSGKAEVVIAPFGEADEEDGQPTAGTYNGKSCSSVYCHGASLSGGSVTSPQWTKVDGSQAACGTCHGLPPTDDHPNMDNCAMCHGCVATSDQQISPEGAAFHINGEVNMEGKGACPTE